MKTKIIYSLLSILFLTSCSQKETKEDVDLSKLKEWLAQPEDTRPSLKELSFAQVPLSKTGAQTAREFLVKDHQKNLLDKYGKQWDDRLLIWDTLQMPIFYQIFGEAPSDGRSLFISMHGGGNAPADVNDQQYKNQQHLYDAKMNKLEGVYLAARAPTNTWNLWHEAHIDNFFNSIIQLAVIKENVNPNRVYIMGYSAGGDGTYQLAPRMGDRWAAAAMMAGHPNETSPVGLRNTPFAIQMGALDEAYDRNIIAIKWKKELDSLQNLDPKGYHHLVTLHEGKGHWMEKKDSIALTWISKFTRNPIPKKIVWKQDDRLHESFFWLKVPKKHLKAGGEIKASYSPITNEVNIESSYTDTLQIWLNDAMLDLDQPIVIKKNGLLLYKGRLKRTLANLKESLSHKGDPNLAFPVKIEINGNKVTTLAYE